jgi:hypothetical protein
MTEPYQDILDRVDSLLDEQTKRDHPALPFDDIKAQFPEQWVAMHLTGLCHPRGGWVGRVFAHGKKLEIVENKAAEVEQKNPAVRCSFILTDKSIPPPGPIFV